MTPFCTICGNLIHPREHPLKDICWNCHRDKILKLFPLNAEHERTDPAFHHVVEMLLRDADPYDIIDWLIRDRREITERWKEFVEKHVNPITYKPFKNQ